MIERMPCRITDGPQTPEEQAEWDSYWDFYWDAVDADIGQRTEVEDDDGQN